MPILLALLFLQLNSFAVDPKYDLVQIDVGNGIAHSGILNMSINPPPYTHPTHGTDMACNLKSELEIINSKPVNATQIKYSNLTSSLSVLSFKAGLQEAVALHPKVVSASIGGEYEVFEEYDIIKAGCKERIFFVFAAGNTSTSSHMDKPQFPGAYYKDLPCVLSVGTLENGKRAPYSNDAAVWLEYRAGDPHGSSSSTARMAGRVLQAIRNAPKASLKEIQELFIRTYTRTQ